MGHPCRTENEILMSHYSAALDEIYRLRRALAYEASVNLVHLDYKTFPKTRRGIASEQVTRMQAAARGDAERVYAGVGYLSLRHAFMQAGAPEVFTRATWEESRNALSRSAIREGSTDAET